MGIKPIHLERCTSMRTLIIAALAFASVACGAESHALEPQMSVPAQSEMLLAQSSGIDSRNYNSSDRNRDRQRPARYVCVITPPDSARRDRPYICPVNQQRVGGRCRCPGVVGNGNVDTA